MKKLLILLLSTVFVALSGCSPTTNGANPNTPGGNTSMTVEKGNAANPTYYFTEDGTPALVSVPAQNTINKLQATDDFGRSVGYVNGYKTDKKRYVGLFYFTWLGWHGGEMDGIYDINKLLDEDPTSLWNADGTKASPAGKYHFWGEPLYGYYNSKDPWVIRKQMELFTMAGIDFIAFDCTNGFEYTDVVIRILEVLQSMYDEGWPVPKFMFYTNSYSATVVRKVYSGGASATGNKYEVEGIYKNNYFSDLYFAPNGKPRIAAVTSPSTDRTVASWEAGNVEDNVISTDANVCPNATKRALNAEILQKFEIWESTWPNKKQWDNGLPWMSWQRPQRVHNDTINVGIAQHQKMPFSDALLSEALSDQMWGRGYTTKDGADHSDEAIYSSKNFEEQWEIAREKDLTYTFVTGWNEWVAIKQGAALGINQNYPECVGKRTFFVDTVNTEFSRDIEMMKGGYSDNAFLSLMRNVRLYKGQTGNMAASAAKTIDITKGLTQWASVSDVYRSPAAPANRNYENFSKTAVLKDDSIRNDIKSVRVTHDKDNLYFLIECAANIQPNIESNNFMNLLIDVEGQSNNAFYGYDYVVNRNTSYTGQCSVEKIGKNVGTGALTYEMKQVAAFTLKGKYMQFKVSKKALGITGNFTIHFKVADNVTRPDDIESYYITGECAPVGRLNYTFKG